MTNSEIIDAEMLRVLDLLVKKYCDHDVSEAFGGMCRQGMSFTVRNPKQ